MRRKMVIIILILVILTFVGGIAITRLLTKEGNITQSKLNDDFEKIEKETNEITQEELQNEIEIAYIDNSEIQNTVQKEVIIEKEQKNTTNESSKSHTQEKTSKNIISNTNKEKEIISVTSNNNVANNNVTNYNEANNKKTQEIKEEIKDEKENISNNNVLNENNKKEEDKTTSLANTTYRKINTEVLPEIKKILENEISKEKELVDFGTTVITTNKSNAYNNTTGFTYMFVNEIEKGKIEGNYVKFEQRVRNTVGAFGKYYIYAEDEFVYNSEGKNPKWSQTLVWIYVRF